MPPRGNNNNNNNNNRARGGRGRGWGRGGPNNTPAPLQNYPHRSTEIDVEIQQWADPAEAVQNGNRGRGQGPWNGTSKSRSGAGTPQRGTNSPRRGDKTPIGRGRGRGAGRGNERDPDTFGGRGRHRPQLGGMGAGKAKSLLGRDAPLSDLLYAARPLLRPVKFVQATLTPFLFQNSEDMLEAADTKDTSHVPTADRVAQLFHDAQKASDSNSDSDSDPDSLEQVDFADLAQIRAEVDAIAQGNIPSVPDASKEDDSIEEVDFADLAAIRARVDAAEPRVVSGDDIIEETFKGVYSKTSDTTQVSNVMQVVDDNDLPASSIPGDVLDLKPAIESSESSNLELDTILVEAAMPNALVEDTSPETRPDVLDAVDGYVKPKVSTPPIHAQDTILVQEEAPDVLVSEDPSPPEIQPLTPTDDIPRSEVPSAIQVVDDAAPLIPANMPNPYPSTDPSPYEPIQHAQHIPVGERVEPTPNVLVKAPSPTPIPTDDVPLFVVDTTPTRPADDVILVDRTGGSILGDHDQDEERIVYVAPHPRSGRASPVPAIPRVKLPRSPMYMSVSKPTRASDVSADVGGVSLRSPVREDEDERLSLAELSLTLEPVATDTVKKAARRTRKKEARRQGRRQRQDKRDAVEGGDSRWQSRRRGDSDLDWGTEDEVDDLGGMEIDPELDLNVDAMQGFVTSMSAEGSRFVTMDDIEAEARMRQEDEEEDGDGESSVSAPSNGDDEEVFNREEEVLIGESGDEEVDEYSDDDELTPKSSFRTRLRKLREKSHGQHLNAVHEMSDDEDEDVDEFPPWTNTAEDAGYTAYVKNHSEEYGYLVERDIDDPEYTTPVNKKKNKGKGKQAKDHLPPELKAQWDKDRAKKAERKRALQTARLLAALDPLHASPTAKPHALGKAMRAAARLDPETKRSLAPASVGAATAGASPDVVKLEAQVRAFVMDVRRHTLALPPMNKEARKAVHELAAAFGVKSVSKGKNKRRYTTLTRTSRYINEDKVRAVVKRFSKDGKGKGKGMDKGKGKGRIKEGEEVGKEAPKIGAGNIGFKMLALMGWSEGDRIGSTSSVGIETPVTAIVKHSKLGLGATRE